MLPGHNSSEGPVLGVQLIETLRLLRICSRKTTAWGQSEGPGHIFSIPDTSCGKVNQSR